MIITDRMKSDLIWWIDNLPNQKRLICHDNPSLIITTDASLSGWGAVCEDQRIGGRWNEQESCHHINYLELLAVSHSLKVFCKLSENIHVQIKSDSTSAVAFIVKMGTIKSDLCNDLAKYTVIFLQICFYESRDSLDQNSLHPKLEVLHPIWGPL